MQAEQIVGILAGILTAIALLPQLIKIWKEKKGEEISIPAFATLVGGLSLWVVYGIMKKDVPIVATNSFSVLVNVSIIILQLKYRKK